VVLEKAVAAWQPVHDQYDVVVVEGLSPGPATLCASGLNQALARAFDPDVLLAACWPPAGRRLTPQGAGTGESAPLSPGQTRPRALPRAFPHGSPSRRAGTRRVSSAAHR
jgi:hypothetical protein